MTVDDPLYMKDPVRFFRAEDAKFGQLLATLTDDTDKGFADFLYQDGAFVEDIPALIAAPKLREHYLNGTLYE